MVMGRIFLGLALVSGLVAIYCMTRILSYLSSKGEKISWFLLRLKWFSYMSKYRELTVVETGDVGPYHRAYIISALCSLVLVIVGAMLLNPQ